jgi:hypothetical protein
MNQTLTVIGHKIPLHVKSLIIAFLIYMISTILYPDNVMEQSIAFLAMCVLFKNAKSIYKARIQVNLRISKKHLLIAFLLYIAVHLGFRCYDGRWRMDSNSNDDQQQLIIINEIRLDIPLIMKADNLNATLPVVLPGPVLHGPDKDILDSSFAQEIEVFDEDEFSLEMIDPELALHSTAAESSGEDAPSEESPSEAGEEKFIGLTKTAWKVIAVGTVIAFASYSSGAIKDTTRAVLESIQSKIVQRNE